jgi:hypothetical protein
MSHDVTSTVRKGCKISAHTVARASTRVGRATIGVRHLLNE